MLGEDKASNEALVDPITVSGTLDIDILGINFCRQMAFAPIANIQLRNICARNVSHCNVFFVCFLYYIQCVVFPKKKQKEEEKWRLPMKRVQAFHRLSVIFPMFLYETAFYPRSPDRRARVASANLPPPPSRVWDIASFKFWHTP